MSEVINLKLHDEDFDKLVHGGVLQASHITIAAKREVTVGGRPGVVIAFQAEVNGEVVNVQATTTLRCFMAAAAGLRGWNQGPESPERN